MFKVHRLIQRYSFWAIVLFMAIFTIVTMPMEVTPAPEDEPEKVNIGASSDRVHLVFCKDGNLVSVAEDLSLLLYSSGLVSEEEPTFEEKATCIIEAIVCGPSAEQQAAGFESFLPSGTELAELQIEKPRIVVKLSMNRQFLDEEMDELFVDEVIRIFAFPLEALEEPYQVSILVQYKDEPESPFKPLPEYLPKLPPVPDKEAELSTELKATQPVLQGGQTPFIGQGQPTGALTGKTVFLSPGHGWYYSSTLGRWATQRPNTNNIIEDLSNGEACLNWLVKYLWNAGANVWPCRERDMNTNMDIIDNLDVEASYTGTWTNSTNVSGYYGTNYCWASTDSGGETATATFTPVLPADGYYAVYVWYTPAGDRSTAIPVKINHSGGQTIVIVNQQQDGRTWRFVGTYYFRASASSANKSVVISNYTSEGSVVIADAVRFGGGMGDTVDGGTVSGEPRWEESGMYFSPFMGCPSGGGTVWAMPRYAKWENESWEDSIYVSWHTNAPDPGTGTSSFAYSSAGWGGPFDGVPGGDILRNTIHNELINDIRAGWDPGWTDRGVKTANFGEINPSNNDEMPASLHEIAFHDTPADAEDLRDPRFRQLAARAVYQGIVKWWHSYGGNPNDTLLPEPPTHFSAQLNGSGGIVLSWNAPPYNTGDDLLGDPATDYRVYISTDGKGFDNGISTGGSTTYTVTAGLTPGTVYYFRVSATNAGGESFPTETLAVRYKTSGTNPILIVGGFDRLDRWCMVIEDDPYDPEDLHREYLERMNSYDYTVDYAEAIDTYNEYFDSCSNEAVESGTVSLGSYSAVIWFVGEESAADDTFSSTEQSRVQTYLNSGGKLFVSGAEIGWDLDYLNNGRSFYNNYLKADYVDNDPYTADTPINTVDAISGSIFSGLTNITFDDGTQGTYDVDYPDVIDPMGGATLAMTYVGSSEPDVNAAIQYDGSDFKVVYLGFPFETIYPESSRNAVMERVLNFLLPTPTPTPTPDIGSEPQALDFGQVIIESSKDLDYQLWNYGQAPLQVTGLDIMGQDATEFSFVGLPSLPLTIAETTYHIITVRFNPVSVGDKAAYVETRSNDPDEDPFTMPSLSGSGILPPTPILTPDIDTEPGLLDFGQVLIGSTQDLDYELWNRGEADLEVTSLEIMGNDADQFSFVTSLTLPLTIAPETCQTIDVRFQPTRICYKDAYIETRSNDPDEDPATSPTLQAKGRGERLELCGIDINDSRLLSIAGDYEFLFSGTPELTVSGSFTQDARGRLTFIGTIREDDAASSITTKGKLKVKKKTTAVYGKLKPVKISALGAKVKLALVVANDSLELAIKYKKKGMAKIERTALAPLVCTERGARIVIPEMNEIKPDKKYKGEGRLILPCGLEVPVTIKEKVKQKKDGSIKRKYTIKGRVVGKIVCNLGLRVLMSSPTAEIMELQKLTKKKLSYVKKVEQASINLIY